MTCPKLLEKSAALSGDRSQFPLEMGSRVPRIGRLRREGWCERRSCPSLRHLAGTEPSAGCGNVRQARPNPRKCSLSQLRGVPAWLCNDQTFCSSRPISSAATPWAWRGSRGCRRRRWMRLARDGYYLTRCYSETPVCVAARTTWMTGQHPWAHGVFGNSRNPMNPENTLPGVLTRHGYRTHGAGKFHFTPDQRVDERLREHRHLRRGPHAARAMITTTGCKRRPGRAWSAPTAWATTTSLPRPRRCLSPTTCRPGLPTRRSAFCNEHHGHRAGAALLPALQLHEAALGLRPATPLRPALRT